MRSLNGPPRVEDLRRSSGWRCRDWHTLSTMRTNVQRQGSARIVCKCTDRRRVSEWQVGDHQAQTRHLAGGGWGLGLPSGGWRRAREGLSTFVETCACVCTCALGGGSVGFIRTPTSYDLVCSRIPACTFLGFLLLLYKKWSYHSDILESTFRYTGKYPSRSSEEGSLPSAPARLPAYP